MGIGNNLLQRYDTVGGADLFLHFFGGKLNVTEVGMLHSEVETGEVKRFETGRLVFRKQELHRKQVDKRERKPGVGKKRGKVARRKRKRKGAVEISIIF
jgi:hypothetical protein